MKGDLRKSLIIWGSPSPDTNRSDIVLRLNNCQKLMDLFLDGKLPLDDYLDLIEAQGVNMDDYAETVSFNLKDFNLV
ncbi:hypothetical protein [Cyanothece sp. BG0011]|uniref:hypothetical protein n=1 Tax=Cyanothece sp. BG0011 TaxID=2082950 RepID=UPI000D1EE84C|nr:hypothetical protein [Cyanothece sp. BG0011]